MASPWFAPNDAADLESTLRITYEITGSRGKVMWEPKVHTATTKFRPNTMRPQSPSIIAVQGARGSLGRKGVLGSDPTAGVGRGGGHHAVQELRALRAPGASVNWLEVWKTDKEAKARRLRRGGELRARPHPRSNDGHRGAGPHAAKFLREGAVTQGRYAAGSVEQLPFSLLSHRGS